MFLLIVKSCENCGEEIAIKRFAGYPDSTEIREVENYIGGMDCIKHTILQVDNCDFKTGEIIKGELL